MSAASTGVLDALLEDLAERVAAKITFATKPGAAQRARLMSIDEAAKYLGRSRAAVEHMTRSGQLPTVRGDRRVFLDVCDLDQWIEENKTGSLTPRV